VKRVYRIFRPDHDGGYHLLFSHPRLLEDLLSGFVDEPWVAELDLDGLERVNAKLLGANYLRANGDTLWRIPLKSGGVAYIYVVLEFQSTPDRWMAVRMAAAVILLYLHLIRESVRKKGRKEPLLKSGKLPPVYPLVLFSGGDQWQAAQDLADLIADVPGLGEWAWKPSIRYHVLAERTVPVDTLTDGDNVVAVLFSIEQCRTVEEVQEKAKRLAEMLPGEENATLRQAFETWLTSVFSISRNLPIKSSDVAALREDGSMLRELAEQVKRERELAVREAIQNTRAETLICLLQKRFGTLSGEQRSRIFDAETAEIEMWLDRVIDAPTLNAVFGEAPAH